MSRTLSLLRVLGYLVTLAMHGSVLALLGKPAASADPRILAFMENQARYLTGWNAALQMVHAALGLACEWLLASHSADQSYSLPRGLRLARDKLFTNIVFPGSCVIATFFWIIFSYDRELVFPKFLDEILTTPANHVVHTLIVPVVLYETLLHPRTRPATHTWNCLHILFHASVYTAVVLYTYYETGLWLYPILGLLSPPAFVFFASVIVGSAYFYYFLQWRLVDLVWGEKYEEKLTKGKKVR